MELGIFTIGHSTHPVEAFLSLLRRHRVAALVDVRRFPGSRRYPQFGPAHLPPALQEAGIGYTHLPQLGGRRRALPDSVNTAWRNAAFRGYADHLATPEFAAGLTALQTLAAEARIALLCAEALWWRCHRRLIADALIVRGYSVEHILASGSTVMHHLTPFARLDGMHISYPAVEALAAESAPDASPGATRT